MIFVDKGGAVGFLGILGIPWLDFYIGCVAEISFLIILAGIDYALHAGQVPVFLFYSAVHIFIPPFCFTI